MQVLQAIVLGKRQLVLIYVRQILVLDKGIGQELGMEESVILWSGNL